MKPAIKRKNKPSRASAMGKVELLLRKADEQGLVAVDQDAASYIAKNDPRVTEMIVGGSDWAKYTLLLNDGTIYQEGGKRRRHYVPAAVKQQWVMDAAKRCVEGETTLFGMLRLFRRASTLCTGQTDVERALGNDAGLMARLKQRILERSPTETQRIADDAGLLETLQTLGVSEQDIKRLTRDHSLDKATLADVMLRPEKPDESVLWMEELRGVLAGGARWVDETVVPFVPLRMDVPFVRNQGGGWWWNWAIRVDGAIHLEGGSRRGRAVSVEVADKLASLRFRDVLDKADLRTLLYHRERVKEGPGAGSLYTFIAGEPERMDALNRRIVALAEVDAGELPLGVAQANGLREAGVAYATVRRLTHDQTLSEEEWERIRSQTVVVVQNRLNTDRVWMLLKEAEKAGWVELKEDTAPFVAHDSSDIAEVLPSFDMPWAQRVVRLVDGSIHFEGGRTRTRVTPPAVARLLLEKKAAEILENHDLMVLLAVMERVLRSPNPLTVYGYLADKKRWGALLKQIGNVAKSEAFNGRVTQKTYVELLERAGVDNRDIRRLTGALDLTEEQAKALAKTLAEARKSKAVDRLSELLSERLSRGWVEVLEDTAPFVAQDAPEVKEVLPPGSTPWAQHVVVLVDESIHMEGGRTRIRVCDPKVARGLIEKRAEFLLSQTDLFDLLQTADRARRNPSPGTAFSVLGTGKKYQALLGRIKEVANDRAYDGRISRKAHVELLEQAGVDNRDIRRLTGAIGLTEEQALTLAKTLAQTRKTTAGDRLSELLSDRFSRGWMEVLEDTAPFVAEDGPDVKEVLPPGSTPWAQHVVVLADESIHMEGGRTRIRVCDPKVARGLIEKRAEFLLAQTDLFDLLQTADRARRNPSPGTAFSVLGTGKKYEALLRRIKEVASDRAYDGRISRKAHVELLEQAGVDNRDIRRLTGAIGLTEEQALTLAKTLADARKNTAGDRLSELLSERFARGWVEVLEDTAPFVDENSPDVYEALPAGATPWAQHVVILADQSIHMEGGRMRIRVCDPKVARGLIEKRAEQLLAQSDLFDLLQTAERASRGPLLGTAYRLLGTGGKWQQLLRRIQNRAQDPVYVGRVHKKSHVELLQVADVDEMTLRGLIGAAGPTRAQVLEMLEQTQQARAERERDWIMEAIESRTALRWIELSADVIPYVSPNSTEIVRKLPTTGWPIVQHAWILADDALHLECGRTRTRFVNPLTVETLHNAALLRLIEQSDLYTLLDFALRCRRPAAPYTLIEYVRASTERLETVHRAIGWLVKTPKYHGKVNKSAHLQLLMALGFEEDAIHAAAPSVRVWATQGKRRAVVRPVLPRATDRLDTLLQQRFRQGWVELHEDVVPFLPQASPTIVETIPGKATPWTRHIAILEDGSIHLEGGRTRIRICEPAYADALLKRKAAEAVRGTDLHVLVDTFQKARTRPRMNTLCGTIGQTPHLLAALAKQIQHVATWEMWFGTVTRTDHVRLLSELGVDVSDLMGPKTTLRFPRLSRFAHTRGSKRLGKPIPSLEHLIAERVSEKWRELEDDAVPYVDATDPRIHRVYVHPDATYRFAALLTDGTIVYEGGTTRRWITASSQVQAVVTRQAQRILATAGVHWLMDLYSQVISGNSRTPIHRWFREHTESVDQLRQRIVTLVKEPGVRFTRPEHLHLLATLT